MSNFIGGMRVTTAPTYDYTCPPSMNASSKLLSDSARPPSYTAVPQASEAVKQRAKEDISSPSHLPSVSYAELLKQWCFARSPTPPLPAQDTLSPRSNSECNSPIWRGISLGMDGFNGLSPHHILTSTKKLFGALSPIGPIPRYLSCLSSFSSQPSPFPLPFHSHWFSSLNAEAERLL